MQDYNDVVAQWAECLFGAPLAADEAASAQAWAAVANLQASFATAKKPIDTDKAVSAWFSDNFMNAPPLSYNTAAFNQVSKAVGDLKLRLANVALPAPSPTLPASNSEQEQ